MGRLADQITLLRHTDRSQGVVTRDHPTRKMRSLQGLDCGSCSRLQFVFEDDQAEE